MALNLAPVNFGAATEPNAMAQIGQALSQYPTDVASSQLQNQQIGQQLLAPYLKMLKANKALENNQSFMGTINHIAKQYDIPIPGDYSDSTPAPETQGTPPAQPGTSAPAVQGSQPPLTPKAGPNAAMTMAPATQVPQVQTPPNTAMEPHTTNSAGQVVATSSGAPIPGAPQPAAQPQQPTPQARRQFNIDPSFIGATLDPATVIALQAMQPEQRAAYLQATGIDPKWVPKSLMSEPPVLSPEMREKVVTGISKQLDDLAGRGDLTPDSFQRIVRLNESQGLLDQQGADALLSDPGYLQQMGKGLELKLQLAEQANYWKGMNYSVEYGRLQQMIKNGASLDQFRDWQEKVLGSARIGLMSVQAQTLMQRTMLESQHDSEQAQYWGGLLQEGNTRLGLQQYGQLTTDLRSAKTTLANLEKQASTVRTNGGDPTESLTTEVDPTTGLPKPGGTSLAQAIVNQQGVVQALGDLVTQANSNYRNVNTALHKQGVQPAGGKPPPGWKATMQLNGKPIGQVNGTWYYGDGTVAQ